MVFPCGSNTDGFNVTKTRARIRSGPHWMKHPIENFVDVDELMMQVECLVDVGGAEHAHHSGIGKQQRLEVAVLRERPHRVALDPLVGLLTQDAAPGELEKDRP